MINLITNKRQKLIEFGIILLLLLSIVITQITFPSNAIGPLLWFVVLFILVFLFYAVEKKIDLLFILYFAIFLFSLYTFTALPGRSSILKQYFPILAFFYTVMFLYVLLVYNKLNYKESPYTGIEKFLIFVSFFFLLISYFIFNTQDTFKIEALSKLLLMIIPSYLFGIILPAKLLKEEYNLNLFLKSFVYLGIISALGGFVTMFFKVNPWSPPGMATSFYSHQNGTSSVYNYCIPATLYYLFFKKEKLKDYEKYLFSAGTIAMLVALLFTFSRSGIISIIIVLVIISIKYSRKMFFISLAFAPVFFVFFVQGVLTSKGAGTALSRFGLLLVAYDMIRTNLFWGYGIISTIPTFERIKIASNVLDQNNTPHNIFLYLLLQIGLFAVLPIIIIVFSIFFKTTKKIIKKGTDPLLLISYCVCFSMIFKNMFEDLLVYPEYFLYNIFWIFWGLMIFINKNNSSKIFLDK